VKEPMMSERNNHCSEPDLHECRVESAGDIKAGQGSDTALTIDVVAFLQRGQIHG
jgi:hypothetical protein